MDINALIELVKNYRNQLEEMKAYIKKQKGQEINEIEERYENEKELKKEIGEYQFVLSQQKRELEHLERDNDEKKGKIGELENNLLTKEGELQNKIQELRTKTTDYNSLKDRFDKKVEEIGILNNNLIKKKEEQEKYIKEESIRIYDKGKYNKIDICTNKMNDTQMNFAINTTRNGINTYSGYYDRVKYVKEQFESKYGGEWGVILKLRECGVSCLNCVDNCYISFKMGEYYVDIVKTGLGDESLRLYDKGNYNEVNILSNTMSEEQKNFAIEKTRNGLKMYDNHFDCAKYISEQFQNKYKCCWGTFLRPLNYGNSYYTFYDKCRIEFNMGEFNVNIFKSSWGDESIHLIDKGDYYKVDILTNKMSEEQKNFAIETTRKSLNMYEDHFDCAKYVSDQFESKYGGNWCASFITRGYGNSCIPYVDDCYISFKMGEFYVKIEKTNYGNESIRLFDKGNYYKVDTIIDELSYSKRNYAIETTRKSLNMYDDIDKCADYVKTQFDHSYSGKWCVIFMVKGYGGYSTSYYDDSIIDFAMGEYRVAIFKSHE